MIESILLWLAKHTPTFFFDRLYLRVRRGD